ncbi:MAG: diacylglycerol kinase [Microcella sp.]|uniref:diacylglycerol/lipid kinase family protein n=1 Tax=Microcella sp. TaxID=1913979 RepID=UPI0024C5E158|nr:diacylglycerol kinase family protein [Microcella sp.]UYN83777.1 MAG: diacylglycerol kinase [Microcella sp.]
MTSSSKRIVVAINPNASFGRGREVGPAVVTTLRGLGHEVTSLIEPDFAQLLEATRAAVREKPDALVVVGGDGMVNLGVTALQGTKVPLGLVPSGTGNDVARGLGIPIGDTEAAIEHLASALQKPPRAIDAGSISFEGGRARFGCILSAGFDALVNERANRMTRPRGRSRYTIALLVELARLRPIDYTLTLDGVVHRERAMLVAVANNLSFGGGMKVAPDASLDDGLFDVVYVKPLGRLAFLRIYPRVFAGTHVTDPRVVAQRARSVRIEAAGVVAYADGERIAPLPVDIEMDAGSLRVLA